MKQNLPLIIVLALSFIIGMLTLRDYGESWDELKFYKYADGALEAYITWPTQGTISFTGGTYDNYGPAYVMFVALGARLLQTVSSWNTSDLRHLFYLLTFLAGLWAFHELARRWLSQTAALGATVLFASQPLFWGHAFISPKDIPVLSFFLLSLIFGLRLFDTLETLALNELSSRSKRTLLVLTTLWLVSVFVLFAGTHLFHAWLDGAVRAAAAGQDNLIARLASNIHKVEPEVYIQKFFVLFIQVRLAFFLLSSFLLAFLYYRLFPSVFRFLLSILPAAVFLGIAVCIRVLAPLAGLLVALYAIQKHGKKSILPLLIYGFLAFGVMYITWPYLWQNPIGHLIESVVVMAKYPWQGQVLFNGTSYNSTDIPRTYLPLLLAIQLTEPVWALFALGLAVTIIGVRGKRDLLILTVIWFIIPLIGFIALRSPLYDNFRQVFFILPPVFFIAGVAFDKIKQPILQIALIVLCVLPGVIDGIRLHPYEYIYYNRFIGGVTGAFRKFELDYWGTSYREAATWLNENAPANANIWAEGPSHLLNTYMRDDLKLYSVYENDRSDHYEYVVALSRYDLDLSSYPDANIVYEIERAGAILTVIKKP